MADSLLPRENSMGNKPLVMTLEGTDYGQMKGDYLLPSLHNQLIRPGDTVSGWIIAEYPKGIKYGALIGGMRLSFQDSSKHWISSKTFAAHPPIYPTENAGRIVESSVIQPLDFFIDED